MATIPHERATVRGEPSGVALSPRSMLAAVVAGSLAAAGLAGSVLPARSFDPELISLVYLMVGLKAALALAATGLLWWRVQWPIAPRNLAGSLGVIAVFVAAPLLIVQGTAPLLTSVAFHAALLAGGLLALSDAGALRRAD